LTTDLHFDFTVSAGISSRRKYVSRNYIHYCGYFTLFVYLVRFDFSTNLIFNLQIITQSEHSLEFLKSEIRFFYHMS